MFIWKKCFLTNSVFRASEVVSTFSILWASPFIPFL